MRASVAFAAFWLVLILVGSLGTEVFFQSAAVSSNVDRILLSPQGAHWFGTDSLGRDLLARIFLGVKVSLGVGILGSGLAFVIGVFWGGLCGWRGGWLDRLGMRFADVLLAVPGFALVTVLVLSLHQWLPGEDQFGKNFACLILGIGLTRWMSIARVARGLVLSSKNLPYIEAARSLGGTDLKILWTHVRPNVIGPLLVVLGLQIPSNILYESFMSFIGIGVHPPQTSWGLLIQEGWRSLSTYPHTILGPSLILFMTVWSLHVLVEGNRRRS